MWMYATENQLNSISAKFLFQNSSFCAQFKKKILPDRGNTYHGLKLTLTLTDTGHANTRIQKFVYNMKSINSNMRISNVKYQTLKGAISMHPPSEMALGWVWGSDASIYRKYRNIGSISIYHIVPYRLQKYRNFQYAGIDTILPNFHVLWQEIVTFSLKLWLNFSSWENFTKFYIITYLSEFQKAVISRRSHCLSSIS